MKAGIYTILNIINNKNYIGQSKNLKSRKSDHFSSLRKNKHHSDHFQNAFNKYGENNFRFIILEEIDNLELLTEKEIYWIKLKDSVNPEKGYNLSYPSLGDHQTIRESTKEKLKLQAYNQFYKNNPDMTLEDFMNGKRAKDLRILTGKQNKKKLYAFNKLTGEKELEFESITAACKYFGFKSDSLSSIIDKDNRTCKGYLLVREENFIEGKEYKKKYKTKEKLRKTYKSFPIEFYNIDTQEIIHKFENKNVAAKYFNVSKTSFNKVLYGERSKWKDMGIRLIKN